MELMTRSVSVGDVHLLVKKTTLRNGTAGLAAPWQASKFNHRRRSLSKQSQKRAAAIHAAYCSPVNEE